MDYAGTMKTVEQIKTVLYCKIFNNTIPDAPLHTFGILSAHEVSPRRCYF